MKIDRISPPVESDFNPQSKPHSSLIVAIQRAMDRAEDAERIIAKLRAQITTLEQDAETDQLTGLFNRRGFEKRVAETMAQASRYRECGALIYIDLDLFKSINDTFGHSAGDAVLTSVSSILDANVRTSDHLARLGGDEFAAILTRTSHDDALMRADVINNALNTASLNWHGQAIEINASVGLQAFRPGDDFAAVLQAADRAMYEAKQVRADMRNAA